MGVIIFLFLAFLAKIKWKPRVEFIDESQMWIMHYNYKMSRKYLILYKK